MDKTETNWDEDANVPHPILDLPAEVPGKIFNKLDESEVPQLCLVSRYFNETVKNYYNFTLEGLDEDSPHLEHIFRRRIVHLKGIKKLEREVSKVLRFQYPNLIQRISIRPDCNISISKLAELLQLYQMNLTNLDMNLGSGLGPSSVNYKFEKLKRLELRLEEPDNLNERDYKSVFSQLAISQFHRFKDLNVSVKPVRHMSSTHYSLKLKKNSRGLERLAVELEWPRDVSKILELMKLLENVRSLKYINFCTRDDPLLLSFIRIQEQLENMELGCDFRIGSDQIESMILNLSQTIVSVSCRAVVISGTHFDLSVFKDCVKLKSLTLSRHRSSDPDVINFNSFPATLRSLSLSSFKILTGDLHVLLDSDALWTLEDLTITGYSPSSLEFGVNSSVLKRVATLELEKRNLRRVELKWNWTTDPVELSWRRGVMEGFFGYSPQQELGSTLILIRNGNSFRRTGSLTS